MNGKKVVIILFLYIVFVLKTLFVSETGERFRKQFFGFFGANLMFDENLNNNSPTTEFNVFETIQKSNLI